MKQALIEAAQAAGKTKHTYLGEQYRRLAARTGSKKAAVAVGHSILVVAWHLLAHECPYQDLGPTYLDQRHRTATGQRLVRRLEQLGYTVQLTPDSSQVRSAAVRRRGTLFRAAPGLPPLSLT